MGIKIKFRAATMDDADMLLEWRNELDTRMASHSTIEILREDHIFWLAKILDNSNKKLLIAEKNGDPVGTVRADYEEGVWELSWTVNPNFRGRGIAKQMVSLFASKIAEPIRAEIKANNFASVKIAQYAGMTISREIEGILYYGRKALTG